MPQIPFIPDIHIEKFSGSGITVANNYAKNVVPGKYPSEQGRFYVTQRPGVNSN